jgi:UDP-N-acetylglucosamine 2-epimerase
MKLRIKSDSLRYRLTRSDVDTLAREGYLEDQINFAGNPLIYAVQLTNGEVLTSSYIDNKITLSMARKMIIELVDTERVGFENKAGELHLLVEKDFTCLDNVDEDQSDNYPNPLLQKKKG